MLLYQAVRRNWRDALHARCQTGPWRGYDINKRLLYIPSLGGVSFTGNVDSNDTEPVSLSEVVASVSSLAPDKSVTMSTEN